ncbi:MAG: poly-gamma-glutamate system protein, partial [Clostridiaceae bacterium]|nr:poly-gamma-glutamate system protein [Clostridiaceae bacterium]
NLLSTGGNEDFTRLRTGLIKKGGYKGTRKEKGLIQEFLHRGVPVINLLNIKSLAVQYGVPVDPYPMPAVGKGDIFYEYRYPYPLIAAILGLALSILVIYGRRVRR